MKPHSAPGRLTRPAASSHPSKMAEPKDQDKAKEAKLAEALRANLRRRKAAPPKPPKPPPRD